MFVLDRPELILTAIEFLTKLFGNAAFGVEVALDVIEGSFQLRDRSFQFASGGAFSREIGLERIAYAFETILFVLLEYEDLLLRVFELAAHCGRRSELLVDGCLRGRARPRDIDLGFQPGVCASLCSGSLRLLTRQACKIENERLERLATVGIGQRRFKRRETDFDAASQRVESALRRLRDVQIWGVG